VPELAEEDGVAVGRRSLSDGGGDGFPGLDLLVAPDA